MTAPGRGRPAAPARRDELARALGPRGIGREARAGAGDHSAVRLWLRLLACSTQIEQLIRARLRQRFGTTLARFDYLAQLERHPDGLRMSQLSRYLMVTGGNVTGLTDQLVAEGWVERLPDPLDRRSISVRLTAVGREHFLAMAGEHEAWLVDLLEGYADADREALYDGLGRLRVHLARREEAAPVEAAAPAASAGRASATLPPFAQASAPASAPAVTPTVAAARPRPAARPRARVPSRTETP
ncbi:transcriptional regulator, MarR family [Piscinibacter sakaiensis]|uniref:Transcriptional regulator, MarR family n=1 Tax=Piscinibacter sakaiensis TaxID=1547922 RepID=A0A0K8P2F7_PISS1|nr:transcriptional regulator, MarR family [Piscinibacter sakaiensis]